jgi:hypothetical protein
VIKELLNRILERPQLETAPQHQTLSVPPVAYASSGPYKGWTLTSHCG